MKKMSLQIFKRLTAVVLLTTTVLLGACKKSDSSPMPNQSIAALVSTNADFSLLKIAVTEAGLVDVLSGTGSFTVFAPNNAAFVAAGLDTEAKIKAVPVATLRGILTYHVLGSKVESGAIVTASNTAVKTLNEQSIFVTKNQSGVFVNGASVVTADIMASNGVVHVINTVLMPATGNIVEAAQANANFTYLVAAVLRASQGSTNVAAVLSGAGPLTVFAPTNQAFIAAGFPTIASIQAADPATLTSILTYHVVSGRVLSSDLTEGAKPATVNGATLTVSLAGGAKVKGNSNANPSNVAQANLITTNGVIHVIDQVLLP